MDRERKVIDLEQAVASRSRECADSFRASFLKSGDVFTRRHFRMSAHDFLDYLKREERLPPVVTPFKPFGAKRMPRLTQEIWEQMMRQEVYQRLLREDPLAFLLELGRRFNRKLREGASEG